MLARRDPGLVTGKFSSSYSVETGMHTWGENWYFSDLDFGNKSHIGIPEYLPSPIPFQNSDLDFFFQNSTLGGLFPMKRQFNGDWSDIFQLNDTKLSGYLPLPVH